ncbi:MULTISPECIES: hypothetical protein [unclassified Pannonibacter]|uniref:hypothetical protein n=1 Tax=unclassified Pannonibacter TaxID=2627228 RepID=UPI0016444305|nr:MULTISPECIES: hypothetical protein [unclassified Pannonibacter]
MSKCPATSFTLGIGLPAAGIITAVAGGLLQAAPGIGHAIGESIRERRNIRRQAEWNAIFEAHRCEIEQIDARLLALIDAVEGIDDRLEKLRFRKFRLSHSFDLVVAALNGTAPPLAAEFASEDGEVEVQARILRDEVMTNLMNAFDRACALSESDPVSAEEYLATEINEAVTIEDNVHAFVTANIVKVRKLESECADIEANLECLRDTA